MAAGNQQVIKDWLGRVLAPYPSSDIVSNDALKALREYPTLQVKTDAFTYDSGQTALLLILHGTLPITYRSQTYHIPLNIWFPFEYPRRPPMVFVVPTKDMSIRKGEVVEPGGRVVGEMMDGWERKWEAHSLAPLLIELQKAFSAQPPVYARGSNPPPPSSAQSSSQASGSSSSPIAPVPVSSSLRQYSASNTGSAAGDQYEQRNGSGYGNGMGEPPRPPARPRIGGMNGDACGIGVRGSVRQDSNPPFDPARPPPLPASPIRQSTYSTPQPQPPPHIIPNPNPYPQGRATPPPPPAPPHPPHLPQTYPQARSTPPPSTLPPYISGQGAERVVPGYVAGPMGVMGGQVDPRYQQQQRQPIRQGSGSQGPVSNGLGGAPQGYGQSVRPAPVNPQPVLPMPRAAPKPPIADLMSDLDDDDAVGSTGPTNPSGSAEPPSRPLPPATLHLHSLLHNHISTRLPQLLQSLHTTTSQLLSVRADLETGEPAILDEMARLEAVKSVCVGVVERMGRVVEEGERRVVDLEGRGETSVDEVVCSISIVHNQLIDLVAEDNAIEDTIYHLARALDSERIDLDRFLKAIRVLSREQYQKRALIEKIHASLQAGRG